MARLQGVVPVCLGLVISGVAPGSAHAQGEAVQLVFTVQPSKTNSQAIIRPAVVVTARDSAGRTATGFAGRISVKIAAGTGNPGAMLFGLTTVAAVEGVATFPNLAIDDEGLGYMLSARATGVAGATSAPFDITPDLRGIELVFTVQPSAAVEEAPIRPAVQVTARESSGRTTTRYSGKVTVSIVPGTGDAEARLIGTTTVAMVSGFATFPNLVIDQAGAGFMLSASAPGLDGTTSAPFDITPGQQGPELVFSIQPSSAAEEATISPAVRVEARDSSGTPASGFTGKVTVSIVPGTGEGEAVLSGTTTVAAVAGVATFADLSIDNAGTGYILSAAALGLAGTTSAPFDITPAAAEAGGTEPSAPSATPAANTEGEDPAPAAAGAVPTLRASARAGEAASIHLDGRLDEPVWRTVDSIGNLTAVEPEEGGDPTGQTIVKVLTSPSELIIGIVARDPDPSGIVSFSMARDAELESEDHVVIVLDPFQDGRSGYVFAVNPSGARFDGLVTTQSGGVNSDWDAVWEAKTARDATGWSAEIRIPILSLSFRKDLSEWGFNVQRQVERNQEISRWSGISQDYDITQTSRAGVLKNLPRFHLGWGLSVRPGVFFSDSRPTPDPARDRYGDFSLDLTQRLGPNLVASGTINTDFGETEVDARQTNLTRFDLFFPEKRTFFLEGADIFEFGLGLDEEFLLPFHSRRIGVLGDEEDLVQIPLVAGGKVHGRIGNTNLGALAVRAGRQDSIPGTTMGVVRLSQNVLDESSVGLLATIGSPHGENDRLTAGLDFTYRTSEFRGDKVFHAGVWGLANNRTDLPGQKFAVGGRVEYPNDLVDISVTYARIGDGFQPALGFLPRHGQMFEAGLEFGPRPQWPLVRQMFYASQIFLVTSLQNQWETFRWTIRPIDWLLESGDRIRVRIIPQGERLGEPFQISDTVAIPIGTFRWVRYNLDAVLAEKRAVSGEITYSFGSFYQGDLKSVIGRLAVKPWPFFTLELTGERNAATLPQGDFVQELYGGRLDFKFTPDFQVSSFLQYDNESKNLGTNTRLRWTFNPLGDLFVVFNHNMLRSDLDRFAFESNQLLVKLQYTLRR